MRFEHPRDFDSSRNNFGAVLHERGVPGFEGAQGRAGGLGDLGRFEQAIALLEHALVVAINAGHARAILHHQAVDECAAVGRVAANDVDVFGGEGHRRNHADQVTHPRQVGLVHAGLVFALAI